MSTTALVAQTMQTPLRNHRPLSAKCQKPQMADIQSRNMRARRAIRHRPQDTQNIENDVSIHVPGNEKALGT